MLKKFFVAAMMSMLVVVGGQINLCAAMSYSEMYLGGLTAGSSYADMVNIYGEPNPFKTDHNTHLAGKVIGIAGTATALKFIIINLRELILSK